ncbi:unnamed protein product [Parnassius mnemosyne]|uniref:Reverse transcriptase domain-containing protein n=1 Tax=Parnassius mnemosyne TaxID=213953 RepID=A0AAV1LS34_9NEOP
MDSDSKNYSRLISFNCKSIKRSFEGVRELCRSADVIALQETWLLPHELPLLSTIDSDFGATGTSAINTSDGLLTGRPYGGVALLWRKSVFQTVSVINCDNVRTAAIKITVSNRSVVIFSVYMPTNCNENLFIFTECLSLIKSIIEVEENCGVEAFYLLGDFNAHPKEIFYNELINFCNDHTWYCADVDMLGLQSNTYTFRSDAHGCERWLDHCIVTQSARTTINKVSVKHDVYWSDHSPLIIECDLYKLNQKVVIDVPIGESNKCIKWGDRQLEQINKYHKLCHSKLKNIEFPLELDQCCDYSCSNKSHYLILDKLYREIVSILSESASQTYVKRKCTRNKGYVTGWNKYVAGAHREARLKFQMWLLAGKPKIGNIYNEMLETRKKFKSKLKWCQNRQEQLQMDLLASNHSAKNFKNFWKNTNKLNVKPTLPVSVGGVHDHKMIANLFSEHFSVQSSSDPVSCSANDAATIVTERKVSFSAKHVSTVIKNMKRGKSPGHDGLSIEHFKYAGVHLPRVLAMFFNLCLCHSYLPEALMRTIVVPILKNKTGDTSDKNNYRPISLATTTAKLLDSLLNSNLEKHVKLHDAQFGFRAELSTESAILSLKHTVNYYTKRRTPVYACFLDLSKAFDRVIYDRLWEKLGSAGVPMECISLLKFWYSNQKNQVRWAGTLSNEYRLQCGVRQGGLSSPLLFNLYVNQLIERLSSTHVGCHIDDICFNNISYADDMVLLSPSINALRTLLSICETYAEAHGLKYNANKSQLLIFKAGKHQPSRVPPVVLDGVPLKLVDSFKYLGHIVTADLRDDEDIERERRALTVRANMLARRFTRCTDTVKITLFKAFCQSFYSSALWVTYTRRAYNALRVQYNNAFRMLLRLPWHCSASGMFAQARADTFSAIIRKKTASLLQRLRNSNNSILRAISVRYDCPIQKHWVGVVIGLK